MTETNLPHSIQEYALLSPEKRVEHLCDRLLCVVPKASHCLKSIMPLVINLPRNFPTRVMDFERFFYEYYDVNDDNTNNDDDANDDNINNDDDDGIKNESKSKEEQEEFLNVDVFDLNKSNYSDRIDMNSIAESLKPHQKNAILNLSDGIKEFVWLLGMCDPKKYVEEVKALAPPSCLCAKVINSGSIGYKCRDCETDQNACFCMDCFDIDKHAGHDYYAVTIESGLCDCGNPIMWNPKFFCDKHRQISLDEDLSLAIPERFRESTLIALKALTRAFAIMTRMKGDENKDKKLFSYISALLVLVKELGTGFGRMVTLALKEKYDFGSRSKLCPDSPIYNTPLWFIIKNYPFLAKKNVRILRELLYSLLFDPLFKVIFTEIYLLQYKHLGLSSFKMYKRLYDKKYEDTGIDADSDDDTYEKDDKEMDDPKYFMWNNPDDGKNASKNVMEFGVQLLYSETINDELNLKTNFFKSVRDILYYIWKHTIDPKTNLYETKNTNERLTDFMFALFYDCIYITNRGTNLKSAFDFDKSMKYIVEVLTPLQSAGKVVMALKEHVLYDEYAKLYSLINFELAFANFLGEYVVKLRKIGDPTLLLNLVSGVTHSVWGILQDRLLSNGPEPMETLSDGTEIISYDITGPEGVSFINPLGHFVTSLLFEAIADKKVDITSVSDLQRLVFRDIDITTFMKYFLEWSLRIIAIIAQNSAGHWVKNGHSVVNLVNTCRTRIKSGKIHFLRYLNAAQICAAVLPKEVFSATFLSRFGLCGEGGAKSLRETQKIRENAVYEALQYLLETALGVYYLPGADPDDVNKYHMIQMLIYFKSFNYAEGQNACEGMDARTFARMLDIVCTKDSYSGKYKVKDEFWDVVNPYYIYNWSSMLNVLEERLEEYSKRVSKPAIFECPRIRACQNPIFERLPAILGTRHVHELISRVICGEFCEGSNSVNSRLLVAALHIMLLSLSDRRVCTEDEVNGIVIGEALAHGSVEVLCDMVKKEDKNSPLILKVLGKLAQANSKCMDISVSILGPNFMGKLDDYTSGKLKDAAEMKTRKRKQKAIMEKLMKKQLNAFKIIEKDEHCPCDEENDIEHEKKDTETNDEEMTKKEEEADENSCIICHSRDGIMGYIGYVQKSNFLNVATTRSNGGESLPWGHFSTPTKAGKTHDPLLNFMVAGLDSSVYAQSCKHCVHLTCILELSRGVSEFNCPCCRKLSNVFIPSADGLYWEKSGYFFGVVVTNKIGFSSESWDEESPPPMLDSVRCASYTLASYEYAARGQSCFASADEKSAKDLPQPSLAAYIENTPRCIAKELYECANGMDLGSKALYGDKVLPLLLGNVNEYMSIMLPLFESFNLLFLGFILISKPRNLDENGYEISGGEEIDEDEEQRAKKRRRMIAKLLISDMYRAFSALNASEMHPKECITLETVLKYCVPFLRRAALLLSVAEKGVSLDVIRGHDTDPYALLEFCGVDIELLKSPDVKFVDILKEESEIQHAFIEWERIKGNIKLGFSVAPCVPFRINVLGNEFLKVIASVSKKRCEKCETFPVIPAICLLCGKLLCAFGECCFDVVGSNGSRIGECNKHAVETTMGSCAFFVPKFNYVFYLSSSGIKGNVCDSPYVDCRGETDKGFSRGKPLFLDQRRLMRLEKDILEYEMDALSSMDTSLHLVKYPNWIEF